MLDHMPIVLIEDDDNDVDTVVAALKDVGVKNKIIVLPTPEEGYTYLTTTQDNPLIILCDIHMPKINGLAFRKSISDNEYLRKKSIPFVFFTGAVTQAIVNEAYTLNVQGFYKKADTYAALKAQLSAIYIYWRGCLHPNSEIFT